MAIRYNKALNREIQRVVRNYNARVQRQIDYNPEGAFMQPEQLSVSELKASVNNRRDLIRKLKSLERYTAESAELVLTESGYHTKYELQELKRELARAKANLSREIREYGQRIPKLGGQSLGLTNQQIGGEKMTRLLRNRESLNKDITKISAREFEGLTKRVAIFRDVTRFDTFKQRLINAAKETALGNDNLTKALIHEIEGMSERDFKRWYEDNKGSNQVFDAMFKIISPDKETNDADVEAFIDDLHNKIREVLGENDTAGVMRNYANKNHEYKLI